MRLSKRADSVRERERGCEMVSGFGNSLGEGDGGKLEYLYGVRYANRCTDHASSFLFADWHAVNQCGGIQSTFTSAPGVHHVPSSRRHR